MAFRLGIIGAGNMGRAIMRGAVEGGVLAPGEILVVDVDRRRRAEAAALGCRESADPAAALAADQIMLAVKPQSFPGVAAALGRLAEPRCVISIMAGVSSRSIAAALGEGARVVRVMPNTPCQVGAGVSAIAPGAGARPGDEHLAVAIFGALGRTVSVDESTLDAVTAVSGSGPAYVFLLAEAMEKAAVRVGLPPPTAAILVRQTILGAGRLLVESGDEPAGLRAAVTSRGGTTEAALSVMLARDLPGIVADAVAAARDRGAELERG